MSIKYHDNKNGIKYGKDEKLTNNWNAEADYKDNEYISVYFRIHTPSYYHAIYGIGFDTNEDTKNFYVEIFEVFRKLGWDVPDCGLYGGGTEAYNGKSQLHLHPQEISGEVKKNEVKTIAKMLQDNKYFSLEWVDLYDEIYDMTDNEYTEYLNGKRKEIINLLLDKSRTTRTNKYFRAYDVAEGVANCVQLKRITDIYKSSVGRNAFTANYIMSIIVELLERGYLVGIRDNEYVRTINKTEQKAKKLYIAENMIA